MEETKDYSSEVDRAVEVMRSGGVILYPTDTVWGLGCDSGNPQAVDRIYRIKQRQDNKALIVLVDGLAMLERHVDCVPEVGYALIEAAVKPLTVVYDRGRNLAHNLLGEDGSVGVRVTSDPFCCQLCRKLRRPIVSTSANHSGEKSPEVYSEINSSLLKEVDYVVDYRRNEVAHGVTPSSVIKLSDSGEIKILRK